MAHLLETGEIIHHGTAEERTPVFQCRLIDDHLGPFRLDTFHHALNRGLAKIVTVRFHRQTVYTHDAFSLFGAPETVPLAIIVVAGLAQHLVRNEILMGMIALHDRSHHILGNILIIGEQLLGVLRQTVAPITKAGVVIMRANTRIQPHALDDGTRIQTFHFCIGVQLVKITYTQSQIGISKQLHGLGLLHSHE